MIILRSGDSCYFETVRDGLVPCKVVSIDQAVPSNITLRVTRNGRTGYKAGETIITTSHHAIPRSAVRRHKYSTTILPYWTRADGMDDITT
jgi:hypothetical protein